MTRPLPEPAAPSPTSVRSRRHRIDAADVDDFHQLFGNEQRLSDCLADKVAAVGGSWGFILAFSSFMLVWVLLNTLVLTRHSLDPYPFIFLNLILSMVAALQAPIIMMSQNRQGKKDRLEARIDAETNAHADAEIGLIQDKLDLLVEVLLADREVRAGVLALINRSRIN